MARLSRKYNWTENTGLMVLLGIGLSFAFAFLVLRRRQTTPLAGSTTPTDKLGSVPHTDFDAAAAIGRETGGEIFDD